MCASRPSGRDVFYLGGDEGRGTFSAFDCPKYFPADFVVRGASNIVAIVRLVLCRPRLEGLVASSWLHTMIVTYNFPGPFGSAF